MRRNIRLLISYDGTDFCGWQKQVHGRSVQGELERALEMIHRHPLMLTGAGRTDSGVHATGQVAHFLTENSSIPSARFCQALNAQLPPDVRVLESQEVPLDFHSRYDATSRRYEYQMTGSRTAPAHWARYVWKVPRMPAMNLLNDLAREICGEHDFSTFAAAGDQSATRHRRIHQAVFLTQGPLMVFRINGNAFLWRMVRSLLGTMMDVASNGGDAARFREILESKDRRQAGPTAPSRGLFLTKVFYGSETGIY